jgi:hypothetical protein
MAYFDVSNLLSAQKILEKKYASAELRMKPAPVFSLLTSNDSFIVGVEEVKKREDRATELYYIPRTKRSSGSARAHNHTGTVDDSAKVTPTWTIKSDKTTISLKLLDMNVFGFETILANKMEQMAMNILEDKETEAIAYLMAQRATTQPASIVGGTFNSTTDSFEVASANATSFFQRVKTIMKQNYFGGQVDIIVDPNLNIQFEQQAAQGAANSTNLGYNWPGLRIVESIELADADYTNGVALAFPTGQASALNWIPKQNRQGWGDYNSYVGGYGTFSFMGFQFALHGYASRSDTSGTNGATQDVTMELELSLDSTFNKAPLSYVTDRTDSVIVEFAQLT